MTSASKERWARVPGYEKLYKVSTHGRVKRIKKVIYHRWGGYGGESLIRTTFEKGIVKQTKAGGGYLAVRLHSKWKVELFKVHSLILLAFVGPCPIGKECRHLDDNKQNNFLSNLKWGTHGQNIQDSYDNGTRIPSSLGKFGEANPNCKLTWEDVQQIRKIWKENPDQTISSLARQFDCSEKTIRNYIQRKHRLQA